MATIRPRARNGCVTAVTAGSICPPRGRRPTPPPAPDRVARRIAAR
ncbi:hypothetical protein [Komagataeibacter medellinensis]|nr:hypothetical protein [Komagataeibacter medellinensis]